MLQQVLARPHGAGRLSARDLHALTPRIWEHVNLYGRFDPDMDTPIAADCSTSGGPRPCWPSCRPHDPDWPHSSSGDTGWPDPNSRVTSRHLGLGEGGDPGVHVEIEPPVEVHVLPDQRRQRVQVSGVQSAGPVRASENLLQHEGVDGRSPPASET